MTRSDLDINVNWINALGPEWSEHVRLYKHVNRNLKAVSHHSIYEDLNQFQDEVVTKLSMKQPSDPVALVADRRPREPSRSSKGKQVLIDSDSSEGELEISEKEAVLKAMSLITRAFQNKYGKTNNK